MNVRELKLGYVGLLLVVSMGCGDQEQAGLADGGSGGAQLGAGAGGTLPGTGGTAGTGGAVGGAGGAVTGSGGTAGGAGGSSDGSGGAGMPGTGGSGGSGGGGTGFPSVSDYAADGPFAVEMELAAACTIHRPSDLGEGGVRHPVILWGNGTTANPGIYAAVLRHWATHGFIVAAADTSNAGSGAEMLACLDYLTAQASQQGSPYAGNVDLDHVGASGHSQGGGGSIMVGADPRCTTTAPLQPYTMEGFGGYMQASIGQQKGPMFLMSGAADLIAAPVPNQKVVFDGIQTPVFWGTLAGADHLASAIGDITGFRGPATAWFRLHLMGDEAARPMFYGQSCGLCSSADWTVETRGIN